MRDNSYKSRRYRLSGAVLLVFFVYVSQLFSLQIKSNDLIVTDGGLLFLLHEVHLLYLDFDGRA